MNAALEVRAERRLVPWRFGATGRPDSRGFLYSPTSVAINGMDFALDQDDLDQAMRYAEEVGPELADG